MFAIAAVAALAVASGQPWVLGSFGSNPVIVFLSQPGWGFLLWPTLAGALLLVGVAIVYNNLSRDNAFPRYW